MVQCGDWNVREEWIVLIVELPQFELQQSGGEQLQLVAGHIQHHQMLAAPQILDSP